MFVKQKCVWEVEVLFEKIVNEQLNNVNKFLKIEKHILALSARGQICTVSALQPFMLGK